MIKLEELPRYAGGTPDETIYSTGCGLEIDFGGVPTEGDSRMQVIYDTDEAEFSAYVSTLSAFFGYSPKKRENEGGIYFEFDGANERVYTYYVKHSHTVRIIADGSGAGISAFCEDVSPAVDESPLLVQYGLYYDLMIPLTTCDCGMCYFIRLRDNRIVMIDGGEIEQCTASAMADVMKRLHALTDTAEGEKITIAAWLCTHAHNDHMDLFTKLIKDYHDEITVERVAFNFPAYSVIDHNECVTRLKERLHEYAPGCRFLKVHTGQKFMLGGVKFEILLTHEDILPLKLGRVYDGMNGTTTVFRVKADGKAAIFLGDLQDSGADELALRYSPERLECGLVQAAHHCINKVESAYRAIRAEKVLIPQSESDCRTRNAHNFAVIRKYNEDENCIFAGNGTDVFRFEDVSAPVEHYPVVGTPYDGSDF